MSYFLSRPVLLIGLPAILAASLLLTALLRARLETRGRRVLFFLTATSLGGILLLTVLREAPNSSCWECLANWPLGRLESGRLGTDNALNIALFLPLGLFATLLWRTPLRVTALSGLLSIAIEVTQPILGIGANDLADIAANTVGAFVGAGLATKILFIGDTIRSRRLDRRRFGKLAIAILISVGLALGISIGGANTVQAVGAQELDKIFAGTTLDDYTRNQAVWGPKLQSFWEANRMPTNDAFNNDEVALERFTWNFYWSTRCVTARWDASGFATDLGSGARCTQRLD